MAWLSGWSKRIKITIDCTNIDSDKTWFPITIFLGASVGQDPDDVTSIFDEVGAESKKIAVTKDDGTTELYVEIEQWDSVAEEAVLHVSLDGWVVASASDTEIYIYYDSTHADNNAHIGGIGSRTEVWDSNFKMVQHMVDTTTSTITDSTSNSYDGTKKLANEPIEADGGIYKGQQFDGADDYIDIAGFEMDSPQFTLETLVKVANYGAWEKLIDFGWGGAGARMTLQVSDTGGGVMIAEIDGDAGGFISYAETDTANFHHVVGTFLRNTYLKIYGDGAFKDEDLTVVDENMFITAIVSKKAIGCKYTFDGDYSESIIDEVRISNSARVAAWIKATYYSISDDLLTFGSVETLWIPKVIMVT